MEMLLSLIIGLLTAIGVFLVLRGRTFPVVLGLTVLSYAVNLFIFSAGRLVMDGAAVLDSGLSTPDPVPQALVLTAIVIGFAMTAFAVILAMRARADLGNDHVDGKLPNLDAEEGKR
jgi:multicomponent K+:H+ antiporter subunit C